VADAKENSEPAASGGGGSNKLVLGVLALNMLALIAVAAILFMAQKKQAKKETLEQVAAGAAQAGAATPAGADPHGGAATPAAAGSPSETRIFSVGEIITNLSGPASSGYTKISVNFEISKDADEEEMKQRKPQFRDRIISLVNSKKPDELQSNDGRDFLKEDIKSTVNPLLKKGKVEGVFFSSFVINAN
jgi:flagellar protein FliL